MLTIATILPADKPQRRKGIVFSDSSHPSSDRYKSSPISSTSRARSARNHIRSHGTIDAGGNKIKQTPQAGHEFQEMVDLFQELNWSNLENPLSWTVCHLTWESRTPLSFFFTRRDPTWRVFYLRQTRAGRHTLECSPPAARFACVIFAKPLVSSRLRFQTGW